MVELPFVLVGDVDIHIQMKLFSQERIFCQALDGVNGILSSQQGTNMHLVYLYALSLQTEPLPLQTGSTVCR